MEALSQDVTPYPLPLTNGAKVVCNKCLDAKKKVLHVQVRLTSEADEAVKKLAQAHARSLNGEIVTAMRPHIKQGK